MRVVKSISSLRKILAQSRAKGQKIGFVPTMGYFHEGHLQLMRRAKKECDLCVVSIFVNPTQFGPKEDLSRYPRDLKRDTLLCQKENVDILFIPSDNDIYSNRYLTYIDVGNISQALCGAFRSGHFRGVATVVAKFLNIVMPDVMYLGQKDAQQVVVLKTMVADLNILTQIQVVPTARETDGLAMSSRNVFLSAQDRQEAPVLYQALLAAQKQIKAGERSAAKLIRGITRMITAKSQGKIQYVACVNAQTLRSLKVLEGQVLIALAVYFGKTRLIDNILDTHNDKRKIKS